MPPKPAQKAKKAAAPPKSPSPKPKKVTKPPVPKKREPTIFKSLERAGNATLPIEVTFEGDSAEAKVRKTGNFGHSLKLTAPTAFSLVKTITMPQGEYEGLQAILIQPAKSLPFLDLPDEARARVYAFYFAPSSGPDNEIVLDGKRKISRDMYAKSYAEGSKFRAALLAVNKEVHDEACPVLYAKTLKLENTTTLLDFLGQLQGSVRARLTSLSVKAYVKTTSRNAMQFLAECGNIQLLHFDTGISSETDPVKAAKTFHGDASKFFEAVAATQGFKTAGVEVLSFGKAAFSYKDEQKKVRFWSEDMVEEFKQALREKLEM